MDGGVPMLHVDYNKWLCRPVEFKKHPCRPVEFKKLPCRMSLRPKKGRVALSILGVHTHTAIVDLQIMKYGIRIHKAEHASDSGSEHETRCILYIEIMYVTKRKRNGRYLVPELELYRW